MLILHIKNGVGGQDNVILVPICTFRETLLVASAYFSEDESVLPLFFLYFNPTADTIIFEAVGAWLLALGAHIIPLGRSWFGFA